MEPVETFTVKNRIVNIYPDENPMNPRESDNLGTMLCFHGRYDLGDKSPVKSIRFDDFEDMERYLRQAEGAVIILPIYLYDHSGITIRTHSFSDPWDSGRLGLIYVTREKLRKEYHVARVTKAIIEQATALLEAEVVEYDRFLTGDCYGYEIMSVDEPELGVLDSCWGFLGIEWIREEAESAALTA